jgi:hypothetical protein
MPLFNPLQDGQDAPFLIPLLVHLYGTFFAKKAINKGFCLCTTKNQYPFLLRLVRLGLVFPIGIAFSADRQHNIVLCGFPTRSLPGNPHRPGLIMSYSALR